MAVKRGRKRQRPYIQFSKKLVTAIMVFWGVIRLWSVIAVWLNPEAGTNMAAIVRGVDDIAMVICLAYTGNSISEKVAVGYFEMRARENSKEEESNESNG